MDGSSSPFSPAHRHNDLYNQPGTLRGCAAALDGAAFFYQQHSGTAISQTLSNIIYLFIPQTEYIGPGCPGSRFQRHTLMGFSALDPPSPEFISGFAPKSTRQNSGHTLSIREYNSISAFRGIISSNKDALLLAGTYARP